MKIYMAPMEGVGGFVYRNAFEKYFGPLDGYVTPFVGKGSLMNREKRDIDPVNNHVKKLIPQIMGGDAEGFLRIADAVSEYGYKECNVNMGCPSGTVTARGRGSGMLKDAVAVDRFCSEVFEKCPMKLSLKTRIGSDDAAEWEKILEVIRKYPWESVTIHPRTRVELYQGPIHYECFDMAVRKLECPLIFNGELRTAEDVAYIKDRYPELEGIMIGRGFLARPELANELYGREKAGAKAVTDWHGELTLGYRDYLSGEKSLLFKLKDLWNFFGAGFEGEEKTLKRMKKTNSLTEFLSLAQEVISRRY